MKTSEFHKSNGQYDQTIDITNQVMRTLPSGRRNLEVPFIPYQGRVGILDGDPRTDFAPIKQLVVEYERYSATKMYSELVKQQEWGDNDLRFFEDHLVTITFVAPNNIRMGP